MTASRPKRPKRRVNKPKARSADKQHPAIGRQIDLSIDSIGHGGDGIGFFEDSPVFVPFALPGDQLTVTLTERRGEGFFATIAQEHRTAARAEPVCPHFGRCGGCQLQHLPTADYTKWKIDQVRKTLATRGLGEVEIRPLINAAPATRRRVRLAFERSKTTDSTLNLGFRERHRRTIVPIEACPIALPAITKLLPALNRLLGDLEMTAKGGEILLTAADTGIDFLLQTALAPNLADREALGAFADKQDLARLTWRMDAHAPAEPIADRRPVQIKMADITVDLPIGAFLQASDQAEAAIRQAINEAIGQSHRIADLFTGCGAFSLPLAAAAGHKVKAYERDPAMIQALKVAARRAGIDRAIHAEVRDLDQTPLQAQDLQNTDAVILDPPRAGAKTQVEAIATSPSPKRIVMASCNPATFARDARLLIDAGYRLTSIQPIDAFLWSTEIELVGAFEHPIPS